MKKNRGSRTSARHFPLVPLAETNRRAGRHHKIVADVLSDLARLDQYSAIKIDLAAVGKKKGALRAALLRAAQKQNLRLATSSDEKHLYVFRSLPKTPGRDFGSPDLKP